MPAADRRADEVYLEEVKTSDIYLGLFGNQYGAEDGEGMSPTHKEFFLATELGKPRFVFVKGDSDAARHLKMLALLRLAGNQLIRRRFNTTTELHSAVYASLVQYLLGSGRLITGPFDATIEVKCMHFHGTQKLKPIPSYQIYKGTVFDLVNQSVDFVMSKLNRSVGTRARSPQAPIEYDIPQEVVTEGIVNAVAHRDYTSNASVEVMLFSDRLEIWNPGTLPPSLTIESLRRSHSSQPGNPLIAEPLFLTKYIEKAGTGTVDMYNQCHKAGMRPPEFRLENGFFILTVWRKQSSGQPESQPESLRDRVLYSLKDGPLGKLEISAHLGQREVSGQLNKVVRELLKERKVELTIPGKPKSRLQKYRLT